ncbi:hypothetical protein ACFL1H_06260 [Nanoarchaeota archaeon]
MKYVIPILLGLGVANVANAEVIGESNDIHGNANLEVNGSSNIFSRSYTLNIADSRDQIFKKIHTNWIGDIQKVEVGNLTCIDGKFSMVNSYERKANKDDYIQFDGLVRSMADFNHYGYVPQGNMDCKAQDLNKEEEEII